MPSTTTTTIIKMIESLPEDQQEKVAEHLREYISDLDDEIKWDISFKRTQSELSDIVNEVKKEMAEGKTEEFNYEKL